MPERIKIQIALLLVAFLAVSCSSPQGSDLDTPDTQVNSVNKQFLLDCADFNVNQLTPAEAQELPPEAPESFIAVFNRVRGLQVKRHQLPPGADLPRSVVEICPEVFLFVNNLGRSFLFDGKQSKLFDFDELLVPRAAIQAGDEIEQFFNTPARIDDIGLRDLLVFNDSLLFSSVEYKKSEKCIALAIYEVKLDLQLGEYKDPLKIYEVEPCLKKIEEVLDSNLLNPTEAGGRLRIYENDKILFTTGPFAFGFSLSDPSFIPRVEPYFEKYINSEDSKYGALLLISNIQSEPEVEIYARGFRNPQGLAIDNQGQIWVSDHGPAGGDELNLIEQGKHYGWPFQTYGLPYDVGANGTPWEINEFWKERYEIDSEEFEDPILAWKPSVAPSEIDFYYHPDGEFADLDGNMIFSTLRDMSLRILTIKDGRVIIDSPIYLNERIRDFVIGSESGKIYAFTDSARILEFTSTNEVPGS